MGPETAAHANLLSVTTVSSIEAHHDGSRAGYFTLPGLPRIDPLPRPLLNCYANSMQYYGFDQLYSPVGNGIPMPILPTLSFRKSAKCTAAFNAGDQESWHSNSRSGKSITRLYSYNT